MLAINIRGCFMLISRYLPDSINVRHTFCKSAEVFKTSYTIHFSFILYYGKICESMRMFSAFPNFTMWNFESLYIDQN